MLFKRREKTNWYRVTYHEVDTTDYVTKVMDGRSLAGLDIDWAFIIDNVEAL